MPGVTPLYPAVSSAVYPNVGSGGGTREARTTQQAVLLYFGIGYVGFSQPILSTFAGTDSVFRENKAAFAEVPLSREVSLTSDSSGRKVFTDQKNQIVARVARDGAVTVLAGNGVRCFSGDGGAETNASLHEPKAAGFDAAENLYIANFGNNRIRRLASAADTSSYAGNGFAH